MTVKARVREPHPSQPIVGPRGRRHFKANAIVRFLYERARDELNLGLNEIAELPFTREDRIQFAQLLGYSTWRFRELPYVTLAVYHRAVNEPQQQRRPQR